MRSCGEFLACDTSVLRASADVQWFLEIPTLGTRPNTSMLADLWGGSGLTSFGEVRISPSLNIKHDDDRVARNMFAIGDIIDFPERHLVYSANAHAQTVSANILAALEYTARQKRDGEDVDLAEVKMTEYKGMPLTGAWLIISGPVCLSSAFLGMPLRLKSLVHFTAWWDIMAALVWRVYAGRLAGPSRKISRLDGDEDATRTRTIDGAANRQ